MDRREGETVLVNEEINRSKGRSALLPIAAFLLARIFFILFRGPGATDLVTYFGFFRVATGPNGIAGVFSEGNFPYPPLAAVIILFPGWLADVFGQVSQAAYVRAYRIIMVLLDLGILLLIPGLLRCNTTEPPSRGSKLRRITLYVLFSVLLSVFIYDRLDIVVAFLIILTLRLIWSGRHAAGGFCLGLGVALKLTPVLIVPPLLFHVWMQSPANRLRRSSVALLSGLGGILAGFLPFVVLWGQDALSFLHYQSSRGIQIESVLSSCALLGYLLGVPLSVVEEARAFSVHFPSSPLVGHAWTAGGILVLLGLTVACWRRRRDLVSTLPGRYCLVKWLILFLSTGIAVSTVFSPQFLVWIFPLVVLLPVHSRRSVVTIVFFGATLVSTYLVFPAFYHRLLQLHPDGILLLVARNALFVGFVILLLWQCLRGPGSAVLTTPSTDA
jgi:hypothetical protein